MCVRHMFLPLDLILFPPAFHFPISKSTLAHLRTVFPSVFTSRVIEAVTDPAAPLRGTRLGLARVGWRPP